MVSRESGNRILIQSLFNPYIINFHIPCLAPVSKGNSRESKGEEDGQYLGSYRGLSGCPSFVYYVTLVSVDVPT